MGKIRSHSRWPPKPSAIVIFMTFRPDVRRQQYIEFVHLKYRPRVSRKGSGRAEWYARWAAADGAWRAVPETIKKAALTTLGTVIVRLIGGGHG